MESIKSKLVGKKFQKSDKDFDSWKLMAEEMSKFFGKPCYYLFYDPKWNKTILYETYKECQERGKGYRYFMAILLNKWKKNL